MLSPGHPQVRWNMALRWRRKSVDALVLVHGVPRTGDVRAPDAGLNIRSGLKICDGNVSDC